jgi:hypothetical protein
MARLRISFIRFFVAATIRCLALLCRTPSLVFYAAAAAPVQHGGAGADAALAAV